MRKYPTVSVGQPDQGAIVLRCLLWWELHRSVAALLISPNGETTYGLVRDQVPAPPISSQSLIRRDVNIAITDL
jgi:hypothetical protein